MLQIDRQNEIVKMVEKYKSVKTVELSKIFNTSRQTIRSDIEYLDAIGKLVKVHGGAIKAQTGKEPAIEIRKKHRIDEKRDIAMEAAKLINSGDTIYLDIGTTVLSMVPYINQINNLTIITNSFEAAYQLANNKGNQIIIIGGMMRGEEMSISGPDSINMLQKYYVDKSFIGPGGISLKAGYTDYHSAEAEVRSLMIKHSKLNIALADDTKFSTVAIYKYADLNEIDILVTNKIPLPDIKDELERLGLQYIETETKDQ